MSFKLYNTCSVFLSAVQSSGDCCWWFYLEHVQVGVQALLRTRSRPGTGRLVVWQDDDVGRWSSPVMVSLTSGTKKKNKMSRQLLEHLKCIFVIKICQYLQTWSGHETVFECQFKPFRWMWGALWSLGVASRAVRMAFTFSLTILNLSLFFSLVTP